MPLTNLIMAFEKMTRPMRELLVALNSFLGSNNPRKRSLANGEI